MLRNIIKLMINNLEYKVKENLKQKEILDILEKRLYIGVVYYDNDSMSCCGEDLMLSEDGWCLEEFEKVKRYLESYNNEVVENVGSKG